MNKITLIIPAKKEPNALPLVLNEIRQNKLNFEIIIILDKNDTETFEAVKNLNCKIIWQSKKGYGNAIIEGIYQTNTKYLCIFYADGSTDPKYILPMLNKLEVNNFDFIFGSRYEKNAYSHDDNFITRIGNFFFTFLGNFFMKLNITDILFTYIFSKTEEMKSLNLKCDDYCLCIEIPFKVKMKNFKYSTYPCVERKRFADKKKVKAFSDGLKILIYFFKKYLNFIYKK
mgnify:FL=1|tara:strand:- start:43 stop:729 length:687 start_codon:yes stop_codon:yes gene_type:complete